MAKTLMILGTGSDVGKSIVATAFCRILRRRGMKVAPFKAQNMSNNSFVTIEGGEIGRAQVAQAEAAGVAPSVLMNPVLLKPAANQGVQVILNGKVSGAMNAQTYYGMKHRFKKAIGQAFHRLAKAYDVIVLEGAGSCCEMNLKANDLVNLPLAKTLKAPCLLVGDIDRGGVFAQLIGTYHLMTPAERRLIMGFIINKFRGDAGLFSSGMSYIEKKTKKPILGLVPYFQHIRIDSEDSVAVQGDRREMAPIGPESINVAVLRLPAISNFTDLEILEHETDVVINYLSRPAELAEAYDFLILPGTKNAMEDAKWLSDTGWDKKILAFARTGKKIVGICGGYQLLGHGIEDPMGVESTDKSVNGLGLLPVATVLESEKILRKIRGVCLQTHQPVEGYEIHMGKTVILSNDGSPFLEIYEQEENLSWKDGWTSPDNRIAGTYVHGLFDSTEFREDFLNSLRVEKHLPQKKSNSGRHERFVHYDLLADHFERHCDVDAILQSMFK